MRSPPRIRIWLKELSLWSSGEMSEVTKKSDTSSSQMRLLGGHLIYVLAPVLPSKLSEDFSEVCTLHQST